MSRRAGGCGGRHQTFLRSSELTQPKDLDDGAWKRRAVLLATGAGLLCALCALFAFSNGWTWQLPIDSKGGLVLLVVGLAATASAQQASRLLLRLVAAAAVLVAGYLFVRFGHRAAFEGGAATAVVLVALAVLLIGATLATTPVEPPAGNVRGKP